jgi:hypothetical protein
MIKIVKLKDLHRKPYFKPEEAYEVLTLTNTIEFKIGQNLSEERVKALCKEPAYNVTIK